MSVALESIGGGAGRCGGSDGGSRYNMNPPGLISRIPFMAMCGSSDSPIGGFAAVKGGGGGDNGADSSGSSSIGKNSDLSVDSAEADETGENEVQSELKGPLDSLDSLEDVLPVKKGISSFYSGKSKSFTSLAEASVISSINDLGKPETSYSKKRKNILASTVYWEKSAGKTSKHSRSGLYQQEETSGTHGALSNLTDVHGSEANSSTISNSSSSSSLHGLPPLHPQRSTSAPSSAGVSSSSASSSGGK